jgi:diguanylate cyclase (GGDEF)-like protein
MSLSLDLTPFDDYESASRAILAFLHERLGFGLWMMTRTEGDDWVVLQAENHGYDVKEGSVFRWADSFCSKMVAGHGPRVAPRAQDVPVYVAAPINRQVQIGAYMGVPVAKEDGSLFGTLCAIDPTPKTEALRNDLPLVELFAKLLGGILAAEQKVVQQARLAQRKQWEAHTDCLTGLLNRRGWDDNVAIEEDRARKYGGPVCVMIVDLDGLKQINDTQGHARGDELIQAAAQCLRQAVRSTDLVARLGGDEFGILAVECDGASADDLHRNIAAILTSEGIHASIGKAVRYSRNGLLDAIAAADQAMYAAKGSKKSPKSRP